MIGIIYGSSMGNTEEAARYLSENLGLDNEIFNVCDVNPDKINSYDKLILGTSTWGSGDLQDDWDAFDFDSLKLDGKTVAIFGMGDSQSYSDDFCSGIGKLYEAIIKAGANVVGAVSKDGYDFEDSKALKDGKFVGLALDADNEGDKTQDRINVWIAQIKPLFA